MCLYVSAKDSNKLLAKWKRAGKKTVTVYKRVSIEPAKRKLTSIYQNYDYKVGERSVARGTLARKTLTGWPATVYGGAIHVSLVKPQHVSLWLTVEARVSEFVGCSEKYIDQHDAAFKSILIPMASLKKLKLPEFWGFNTQDLVDKYQALLKRRRARSTSVKKTKRPAVRRRSTRR